MVFNVYMKLHLKNYLTYW